MKETTKTSRTAGQLEKMWRAINEESFGSVLEEPIITIQSTKGAYGHITCARTWKAKDTDRFEINISSDYLSRPIENVCATLIHEMVHEYHLMNGVQDCSRGGTYHNKTFKEEAEKHMLHIEKDTTYGWTVTSPTDELLEFILRHGWEDIKMGKADSGAFGGFTGGSGTGIAKPIAPKPTSSSRKYKCPECGNSVRATKAVNIMCVDCLKLMIQV